MAEKNRVHPALPLTCAIGAGLDALVLLTNLVRCNWNLGVAFLCLWNLLELAFDAAAFVIWWDNGVVRLYVFCDIASHIQLIAAFVKPMATLIITRRLYLIARLKTTDIVGNKRRDAFIEWTLGLAIPLIAAGPLYYVIQTSRFTIVEGFGCTSSATSTRLSLLLVQTFNFVPSLISVAVYYPKVASTFYHHNRSINEFLRSNGSISRTSYMRILALASIDVILTLPIGLVNFALTAQTTIADGDPFYEGWTKTHSNWEPVVVAFTGNGSTTTLVRIYLIPFLPALQAFFIFGLLGLTPDARASYRHALKTMARWVGCAHTPPSSKAPDMPIQFVVPQLGVSNDTEWGSRTRFEDTFASASSHATDVNKHVGVDHDVEKKAPESAVI